MANPTPNRKGLEESQAQKKKKTETAIKDAMKKLKGTKKYNLEGVAKEANVCYQTITQGYP